MIGMLVQGPTGNLGFITWKYGLEECPCRVRCVWCWGGAWKVLCFSGRKGFSSKYGSRRIWKVGIFFFFFCSVVELLCFTLSVALGQRCWGCPLCAQTQISGRLHHQACPGRGWNTKPGSACRAGWGKQKVSAEGLTSPDKPWLCPCRRWCCGGKGTS